jgi:hypothetical protein
MRLKKGTPQYKSRFLLKNERKMAFVPSGSNYFNVDCLHLVFGVIAPPRKK